MPSPREMHDMRCRRHPDRVGDYAVALHYVSTHSPEPVWNAIKAEQLLGPLCADCRLDLIGWAMHLATEVPS